MSAINGSNYINFLLQIKTVADEVKSPLINAEEIDRYTSSEETRNASSFPDLTVEQVAKKIDAFSQEPLIFYEAASRAGLDQLRTYFLEKWSSKINATSDLVSATKKSMADQAESLKASILLLSFSNPMQAESDLQARAQYRLVKDIVHIHFHPSQDVIPDHAKPYLYAVNLGANATFYVQSQFGDESTYGSMQVSEYASLVTTLNLNEVDREMVTDEVVRVYLLRFPNLRFLDATACPRLTERAFDQGHPNLEKISVTGTRIQAALIERTKFPKLVEVVQENAIRAFDLGSFIWTSGWDQFCNMVEHADKILVDPTSSLKLRYALAEEVDVPFPRMHAMGVFLANVEKITPPQPHLVNFVTSLYFGNIKYFTIEHWNTYDSRAVRFMTRLWILASEKSNRDLQYIRTLGLELAVTDEYSENNKLKEKVHSLTPLDIAKIRFVLRRLLDSHLSLDYPSIAQKLCQRMKELEANCSADVATRRFMNEILVELTYITPEHERAKVSQLAVGSLEIGQMTEQTVAAALALRIDDQKTREKMLRDLILHFTDQTSNSSIYPFPSLILGVSLCEDFPEQDMSSLLTRRVLAYGGIMREPVSQEFKDEVFKMLLEGRLGGKEVHFVDALGRYFLTSDCTEAQKEAIFATLKSMAGIKKGPSGHYYANLFAKGIGKYASDKFFELKTLDKARSRTPSFANIVQVDAVAQLSNATSVPDGTAVVAVVK